MNEIRAWKDPQYRASLSADERARLSNPAGMVELSDDQLDGVGGGTGWLCATVTATIGATITICSPNGTLCGSCRMGTRGCC